jgi:hypothetical protein
VRDSSGNAIVGAEVTLTGGTVSRSTQTDNEGQFFFLDVAQGDYLVAATFGGFSAEQSVTVPD